MIFEGTVKNLQILHLEPDFQRSFDKNKNIRQNKMTRLWMQKAVLRLVRNKPMGKRHDKEASWFSHDTCLSSSATVKAAPAGPALKPEILTSALNKGNWKCVFENIKTQFPVMWLPWHVYMCAGFSQSQTTQ